MIRQFVNSEVLLKIQEDPLETSKQLDDILEAEVVLVGDACELYKDWIGKKVLVRRDQARELKQPYFDINERIVPHEKFILCKYQR